MKTLVVASDFTGKSKAALDYAVQAAEDKGLKLVIFYRYEVPPHILNARVNADAVSAAIKSKALALEHYCDELRSARGVDAYPHFATGDFFEALDNCLRQESADIFIMGMPKRSIEVDLLGNTTTEALSRLKVPMLIVPNHVKYKGVKKLLFACDLLSGINQSIYSRVKEIAQEFGAAVEVLHVTKKAYELQYVLEKGHPLTDALKGLSYNYKNVTAQNILAAIKAEVAAYGADMLIMVPKKYGFWASLIHSSKTKQMAAESTIPLLAIPFFKA
jgi:nucleotide-binding universal stress UspA family protein